MPLGLSLLSMGTLSPQALPRRGKPSPGTFITSYHSAPPDLSEKAKVLDNFYVPTRYSNGHPQGAPFHHSGKCQSREAIRHAGEIVAYVRAHLAKKEKG